MLYEHVISDSVSPAPSLPPPVSALRSARPILGNPVNRTGTETVTAGGPTGDTAVFTQIFTTPDLLTGQTGTNTATILST